LNETSRQDPLITLLDEQGRRLYATLARLTLPQPAAADLFQELFLRLGQSPAFFTANDPSAYAWRTAINLAMEWRRRQHRRRHTNAPIDFDESPEHPDFVVSGPSPLDRIIRQEQTAQMLDALGGLTDLARECFVLRWIENESYASIAAALGKSQQQVRGMCHAAMRQLRDKLAPGVHPRVQTKVAKADG
jgi:RNA polymerase sigma factor (sigma-70 family)